eukprot:4049704-Pyramimonas_sp.AAC.1
MTWRSGPFGEHAGENYVGDWVAYGTGASQTNIEAWPAGQRAKGCLRLGSHSVIFDPDDIRIPILKFPFTSMQSLQEN